MADSDFETQVVGDSVLTISPPTEENTMTPMELLQLESVGNIQRTNAGGRDSAQLANSVLGFAAARNFDELGTVEGRANSGVNATPMAGPTTAGA